MRILLIEDDRKVASFIQRGLSEAGYAVDVVHDGRSGQTQAEVENYDLLIVDWMLPNKDGVSVCRDLRSRGYHVPILILTARETIHDRVTGLDAGADDYLTKPFAFNELLARIRALLRRGTRALDIFTVDDLEMNLSERRVTRGGQWIELSNREFSILEYLLRNKNRLVTRTSLTEHVWDIHFDRGTNIVDVYINYLRKKIDTGTRKPLIHTLRGAGYILKEPD